MNEPTPPRVFHTVANIGNIAFVSTPPSHFFLPFPLPAFLRPASELLFQAFPNFFGNNNSGGSPALGIGLGERVEAAKRCATRRAVPFFPSSLRFLPFCSLSFSLPFSRNKIRYRSRRSRVVCPAAKNRFDPDPSRISDERYIRGIRRSRQACLSIHLYHDNFTRERTSFIKETRGFLGENDGV